MLQVLLGLQKSLRAAGFSLWIERDNPHIREYLRLSGLSEHFPVRSASPSISAHEVSNG
jgi:anti-anti-sigma regulatory factor